MGIELPLGLLQRLFKKRYRRISPENSDDDLGKYTTTLKTSGDIILDVRKLPPKNSQECIRLLRRRDVQQLFSKTVIKSLTDIENTLDSMLEDSWEAFKPFLSQNTSKRILLANEMTEIEMLANILIESDIRSCKDSFLELRTSLAKLRELLTLRLKSLRLIKLSIQAFYKEFSKRYPKSVSPALSLWKDFDISRCNFLKFVDNDKKLSDYVSFRFYSVEYTIVFTNVTDGTEFEWKRSAEESSKNLRQIIFNRIRKEINERTSFAFLTLKGSLFRINQIMKNPNGQDHICLEREMKQLTQLFEFRHFSLPTPSTGTILFFVMRIESRIKLLEKALMRSMNCIKMTESRLAKPKQFQKAIRSLKHDNFVAPPPKLLEIHTDWGNEAALLASEVELSLLGSMKTMTEKRLLKTKKFLQDISYLQLQLQNENLSKSQIQMNPENEAIINETKAPESVNTSTTVKIVNSDPGVNSLSIKKVKKVNSETQQCLADQSNLDKDYKCRICIYQMEKNNNESSNQY